MSNPSGPESKADATALIPLFKLERTLNQDQAGRRLTLLGSIKSRPALLTLERSSFPTSASSIPPLLQRFTATTNLGANDIYRWYLSSLAPPPPTQPIGTPSTHDLKLNLIYPCTPKHISKYTCQRIRSVTETPKIYTAHIHSWISLQREQGRLDWIFNILDGITEQEDVLLRSAWGSPSQDGFLLLPDLNWDRKTVESLHLLALVQRRDIWSIRDLKKKHVSWLRNLRSEVVKEVAALTFGGGNRVEEDELKLYCHYHPTYYHFHIHVVHVMLEAEGGTQNVGKAWELGGLIATLEGMQSDEMGLDSVDISYVVGEESEIWKQLWGPLKRGAEATLGAARV